MRLKRTLHADFHFIIDSSDRFQLVDEESPLD